MCISGLLAWSMTLSAVHSLAFLGPLLILTAVFQGHPIRPAAGLTHSSGHHTLALVKVTSTRPFFLFTCCISYCYHWNVPNYIISVGHFSCQWFQCCDCIDVSLLHWKTLQKTLSTLTCFLKPLSVYYFKQFSFSRISPYKLVPCVLLHHHNRCLRGNYVGAIFLLVTKRWQSLSTDVADQKTVIQDGLEATDNKSVDASTYH